MELKPLEFDCLLDVATASWRGQHEIDRKFPEIMQRLAALGLIVKIRGPIIYTGFNVTEVGRATLESAEKAANFFSVGTEMRRIVRA